MMINVCLGKRVGAGVLGRRRTGTNCKGDKYGKEEKQPSVLTITLPKPNLNSRELSVNMSRQ